MKARVIVVADTHLPRFGRHLPQPLLDALPGADLILHAGDITEQFVLDLLAAYAPVVAVAGNNDSPEVLAKLPPDRVVDVAGVRIGLTHGHLGPGRTTPVRAQRRFATADPPVDAVAFGHSHMPMVRQDGGVWMLNPGSPTDRRRAPEFSYIRLEIADGRLRPTLQTYPAWRGRPAARLGTNDARHAVMTDQPPPDRDPEGRSGVDPSTQGDPEDNEPADPTRRDRDDKAPDASAPGYNMG